MNNTFTKLGASVAGIAAPFMINSASAATPVKIQEPSPTIPRQEIIQASREAGRNNLAEIFKPSPTVPPAPASEEVKFKPSTSTLLAQQSVAQNRGNNGTEGKPTITNQDIIRKTGDEMRDSQNRINNFELNAGGEARTRELEQLMQQSGQPKK